MLSGCDNVPLIIGHDYWIAEWEGAPLLAFRSAIDAGYHGCKAFLATVKPADLDRTANSPFGEMTLGGLLLLSFAGHIGRFHSPQLAAFVHAAH
jgi:hypothetical protein